MHAGNISLHSLVAIATSFDKLENEIQINHLHAKRKEKIANIGPVYPTEVIKSRKSGGEKAQVRTGICLQNIIWCYTY